MSVVSLAAMENKKGLNKQVEKQEVEREFLLYPEDADLKINEKNLPEGVVSLYGNMFLVPKGMDTILIHKTLVPERIADFKIKNSNMTK